MHQTPASLLERLRLPGEQQAWERFVEMYTPLIYHWARRVGLQDQDAADLVQDVLTTAVRKLPQFTYDPGKSFRGWLRAVTLNRWRDKQKQRGRQPLVGDEATLADLQSPENAEAFWEVEYRQQLVGRALSLMRAEFQPATWQACWLFVVDGKSAAQVAIELGITENAVYLAKGRVLRRLREEMAGLID